MEFFSSHKENTAILLNRIVTEITVTVTTAASHKILVC
jgi:hypothetical protein